LTKSPADKAIPPALKALGGWESADWFCPSVVDDDDVLGFTLPKTALGRSQNFRLVERSVSQGAAKPGAPPPEGRRGKQVAGRLGLILDLIGVAKAAAYRRATMLFAAPAVLFFAEIPAARLKSRAANKLRKDLIENDLKACVLQVAPASVVAMFWPNTEHEITAFVEAATPQHALHPHFRAAEQIGRHVPDGFLRAGKLDLARRGQARVLQDLETERNQLLKEVGELRTQIDKLARSQSALGAMEQLGLDEARLKSMLVLLHPDKHGNSAAANDAAKWVNGLRDLLKARGADQ